MDGQLLLLARDKVRWGLDHYIIGKLVSEDKDSGTITLKGIINVNIVFNKEQTNTMHIFGTDALITEGSTTFKTAIFDSRRVVLSDEKTASSYESSIRDYRASQAGLVNSQGNDIQNVTNYAGAN